MSDDTGSGRDNNPGSGPGCSAALLWPMCFFALSAAMLAWPGAMASSGAPCAPESLQDDLLDCFIAGEWGKPEAVALCFIIGLLMMASAAWQRARADDA